MTYHRRMSATGDYCLKEKCEGHSVVGCMGKVKPGSKNCWYIRCLGYYADEGCIPEYQMCRAVTKVPRVKIRGMLKHLAETDPEKWELQIMPRSGLLRLWRKDSKRWKTWAANGKGMDMYLPHWYLRAVEDARASGEPVTVRSIMDKYHASRISSTRIYNVLRDEHGWQESMLPSKGRGRPARQLTPPAS